MKRKKLAVRKFITAVKEQPVKFRKLYIQKKICTVRLRRCGAASVCRKKQHLELVAAAAAAAKAASKSAK